MKFPFCGSDCITCPSRMNQVGPWQHAELLDRWIKDRWSFRRILRDRIKAAYIRWRDGYDRGGTRWKWPWKPRSCNFCGSIHPDDALRLLSEGWCVDHAGKSYKRYLNPPGGWSPVPPVKLYVWHFDEAQWQAVNQATAVADLVDPNQ